MFLMFFQLLMVVTRHLNIKKEWLKSQLMWSGQTHTFFLLASMIMFPEFVKIFI